MKINGHILQQELVKFMKSRLIMIRNVELILCLIDVNDSTCRFIIDSSDFNSPGKPKKTYPSFGTDFGHMMNVTESLIFGNENIDQNVQLE